MLAGCQVFCHKEEPAVPSSFFYQKQYKLRRLGPARCREVSVAFRFLLRQGLSLTNGNTPEAPKRMKSMDTKGKK